MIVLKGIVNLNGTFISEFLPGRFEFDLLLVGVVVRAVLRCGFLLLGFWLGGVV